ncbi:MAG: dihydropyrimidinase [Actinomycetota bacterium]
MGTMRTLISNGTVVTAATATEADVIIEDERVAGVVDPGSAGGEFDRVIDATGRYVIPGGVDMHTHMELPVSDTSSADTYATGTRAAAIGGTTTIVDYAGQTRGSTLKAGLAEWMERAEGESYIDYGFHMMVTDVHDGTLAEFAEMMHEGVTTFKLFTAYPGVNLSDDRQILEAMQVAASVGATIMMHAENGIAIDALRDQAVERGETDPIHHLLTRPASMESEAVHRVAALAEIADCPLVIVHISSQEAFAEAVVARDRGLPVFAETCPQYLWLAQEDLPEGFEAAKFVCSPPLRRRSEGHHAALWSGIGSGRMDAVATDHCPFTWEQKEAGRGDFRKIPNGLGVVEHRMDLVYQGVLEGWIPLTRWIEVTSETPAKLSGIYPRKGTIAPGSDADIVIYDPAAPHTLSAETHHMNLDYSVFEGAEIGGRVESVLSRGKLIVDHGEFIGDPGHGQYLHRGTNALLPEKTS